MKKLGYLFALSLALTTANAQVTDQKEPATANTPEMKIDEERLIRRGVMAHLYLLCIVAVKLSSQLVRQAMQSRVYAAL